MLSNLSKFREIALINRRRKWYRDKISDYDSVNLRTTYMNLKQKYPKEFDILLKLSSKWGTKKSNLSIYATELCALRYPLVSNTCEGCGKPTYLEGKFWKWNCGNAKCRKVTQENSKARFKKTSLERYGVEYPYQSQEVQQRYKKTMMQRYGVESPSQMEGFQDKYTKAMKERYGECYTLQRNDIRDKAVELSKSKNTRSKIDKTNLERYGVVNPYNIPYVRERNLTPESQTKRMDSLRSGMKGYSMKLVTDRFGVEHKVQGYEHKAINYFSDMRNRRVRGIKSITSTTRDVPRYRYRHEGKTKNYYPDLLVVSTKMTYVVEVKSRFTLNADKVMNIKKFRVASKSCERNGWTFIVMVFDESDSDPVIVVNPKTLKDFKIVGLIL